MKKLSIPKDFVFQNRIHSALKQLRATNHVKWEKRMLRRMDSARMLDSAIFYLRSSRVDLMYDRAFLEPGGAQFYPYQRVNFNIFLRAPSFTTTPRNFTHNLQLCRSFNSSADYAKLGLPPTASRAEIKSAYFSLVKKLHPDSGGDAKQFNEVK